MLNRFIILLIPILFPLILRASGEENLNFTHDWFTHNIADWDKLKSELYNKPNKRCLEIGSLEGRSSLYIVENYCNGEGSHLDCIDPWEDAHYTGKDTVKNLYETFMTNTHKYQDNKKIIPHRGFSKDILLELLQKVKNGSAPKYDFIYIDGSHLAKDVLIDAVLAWELLNIGGILIFDDYKGGDGNCFLYPKLAIDGFLSSYKSMYEIIKIDYQVHIKKIADNPDGKLCNATN